MLYAGPIEFWKVPRSLLRGVGFVQVLVNQLRTIISAGEVDSAAVGAIEAVVGTNFPRLREALLINPAPRPGRYLCYEDPHYGFVVMALVWGPGDATPIHDHGTWGVELVLHNQLRVTTYTQCETLPEPIESKVLSPGAVMHNLPPARDVHKIEHASGDYAISLHIYGKAITQNRSFIPGIGFQLRPLPCSAWPGHTSLAASV